MILCRSCGVILEDDARSCPLCSLPVREGPANGRTEPARPRQPRHLPEARRRIRRWVLEVLSLVVATGSAVVLAVDLATGATLTWAHFPLVAIWYLWLAVVLPLALSGRRWAILPAEAVALLTLLFALDRFTAGRDWFLPLALPTVLLGVVLLALVLVLTRRLSPFAVIAGALLAAGFFVVGLDLLLNHAREGRWAVGWSAVVFACVLPVVLLLLYLRKWYRHRQAELRKLLHI
jgi:hypothetical protein